MKKAGVFGIGANFLRYEDEIRKEYEIVCLGDNDTKKFEWGYKGLKVLNLQEFKNQDFDVALVATIQGKLEIMNDLYIAGIPKEKIIPWFHGEGRMWKHKKVIYEGKDVLKAEFDDLRFVCHTSFQIAIIDEIFFANSYGVYFGGDDAVVIDIGMNVGIASLFFAHFPNVSKVYSYEPFPHIYEQAVENIAMNEDWIKNKICPKNVGLSDYNGEEYFVRDSMHTLEPLTENSAEDKEQVKIIEAGAEIRQVIDANNDKKIVVKIDVEGQEYKIFEEFAKENILSDIDIIIMETHQGREKELKVALEKNGFIYFDQYPSVYTDIGMLYAVNMKK